MDDQRHVQVLHDHVDAERERGDAPEEAVDEPVVVVVALFLCAAARRGGLSQCG